METSDKERIEKAAAEHSNSFNPSEHIHSEEQIRQLKYYAKKDFKIGAEYERTIADQQLKEKDKEIENLKSVMVAAAEEIMLHWQAHCDKDGYGPSSLLNRLEKGLASSYSGYKPGNIEKMDKEIAFLKEALRKAKYFIDDPEDMPSNREVKEFILEIENLLT